MITPLLCFPYLFFLCTSYSNSALLAASIGASALFPALHYLFAALKCCFLTPKNQWFFFSWRYKLEMFYWQLVLLLNLSIPCHFFHFISQFILNISAKFQEKTKIIPVVSLSASCLFSVPFILCATRGLSGRSSEWKDFLLCIH